VGTDFHNLALLQNNHLVGVFNRRQAVGNNQCRPVFYHFDQGILDGAFRFTIQRRCCLVQYQDRRVFEQSTGNRQPLPLSARQQCAVFSN